MHEYTCVVKSSTGEIVASFLHHFDAQSFMKSNPRYALECDLLILPLISTHVDIDDPFGESKKV